LILAIKPAILAAFFCTPTVTVESGARRNQKTDNSKAL